MLRPVVSDYMFNKEDAKKKLMKLQEYLDMGIITQEQFNNKTVCLKKILLGNQSLKKTCKGQAKVSAKKHEYHLTLFTSFKNSFVYCIHTLNLI